jgi:hypothetical protein
MSCKKQTVVSFWGVQVSTRVQKMARFKSTLDKVHIAAPCSADWDNMFGNERVRFCQQCQLNVYNLSEMSKAEAERLIGQTEGRLCVRFYRRQDGSIITQNCPVGLRAIKRRLSRVATAAATSILSFIAGIGFFSIGDRLLLQRHVMGQPVMVDHNPVIPPTRQGELAVSPSPENFVMGKLVPTKTHRTSVSTFKKLR